MHINIYYFITAPLCFFYQSPSSLKPEANPFRLTEIGKAIYYMWPFWQSFFHRIFSCGLQEKLKKTYCGSFDLIGFARNLEGRIPGTAPRRNGLSEGFARNGLSEGFGFWVTTLSTVRRAHFSLRLIFWIRYMFFVIISNICTVIVQARPSPLQWQIIVPAISHHICGYAEKSLINLVVTIWRISKWSVYYGF